MNWFFTAVRALGASFPVSASFVQLNAELDSHAVQQRLARLEDPISGLHPDVRALAQRIYEAISRADGSRLEFDDAFYEQYRRPLAILEAHGLIKGTHTLTKQFYGGFRPSGTFVVYMAALYEDPAKMDRFITDLDSTEPGRWLRGHDIARSLTLPSATVRAFFEIYEARGLGILSKEIGALDYRCRA